MRLRCGIIEDEPLSAKRLERLLKEIEPNIEVLFIASDCQDAIRKCEKCAPEVLFVDINLGDCNAFDILKSISFTPRIVFITAYDEYAVRAFEENAVDYILKPLSEERLRKALDKLKSTRDISYEATINKLKNAFLFQKFPIKLKDEIIFLDLDEIIYIQADNKRVILITERGNFTCSKTMNSLERDLPHDRFLRVHKSYIVSLKHIAKVKKWFARGYMIEMTNGDQIKISKGYQETFLRALGIK